MQETIELNVNGRSHPIMADPDTPLLYILRNDLELNGPKYGCGLEQCGSCKVLVDGVDVPSCQLPIKQVVGLSIVTLEGLGSAEKPHPLQEAFVVEQAIQCGYCVSGMIIAAQGLLNRTRYPTETDIREALANNICRCGVYERVRRAIQLRIGRPNWEPVYEVVEAEPLLEEQTASALGSLNKTADLDRWLRIEPDETIAIFSGKVELGQGIKTALAQIAAEELDVALSRIRVVAGDTAETPDEGITAGSMSLQMSGMAIRHAAAAARNFLLEMAVEELETAAGADGLRVEDGWIVEPATGQKVSYWQLMGGRPFGRQVDGQILPKSPAVHQLVGTPATRTDLLAKVTGAASFVHDLRLPGMVHGRVVRPPSPNAQLLSVDETAVLALPGVLMVPQSGRFLAVIAEREEQAIAAAAMLRATAHWKMEPTLPPMAGLDEQLVNAPSEASHVLEGTAVSDPIPPAATSSAAVTKYAATYFKPFIMHASLGPSAAVAQLVDGQLTVWSHSQGIALLRQTIAKALSLSPERVRVIHMEGAGCYGHNGADDAALDAALLAAVRPGRPVSLKWSRTDEHGWEPYGAAMVVQLDAGLDENGRIAAWNHELWSYPQTTRPRPSADDSGLLAAWHLERPLPPQPPRAIQAFHFGEYRNADPLYTLPNKRIVAHFVPDSPLRTSSLRSLGAFANVFASESFMDELAYAAGVDPVEFRLRHMDDARARAVIEAAAKKANWQPQTAPAKNGRGRGFAFARYKNSHAFTAVIVDLTVDQETGAIQLEKAVIAADAGQVINPDGLSNQLEGGFLQAASWTLLEEVAFDENGVTSLDWESYPVLRAADSPVVETVLLNRREAAVLGGGEAVQGPTPAAIANAVFDALGVRLRTLPLQAAAVAQLAAGRA